MHCSADKQPKSLGSKTSLGASDLPTLPTNRLPKQAGLSLCSSWHKRPMTASLSFGPDLTIPREDCVLMHGSRWPCYYVKLMGTCSHKSEQGRRILGPRHSCATTKRLHSPCGGILSLESGTILHFESTARSAWGSPIGEWLAGLPVAGLSVVLRCLGTFGARSAT